MLSPFSQHVLFHVGPAPITVPVVTTWGIMIVLTAFSWFVTRRLDVEHPGALQNTLELLVETEASQIRDVIRRDPGPFLPLLGTLFLYLVVANLAGIVPGVEPPTAHLETPAALGLIVFFSVHVFGMRIRGVRQYLSGYLKPNPVMLPFNVLSELTRTFSLMVRLFGNIMSHEIVIGLVVSLAGLLVPIPLMLLGILIGLVQAYIFTILATVFVAAAIGAEES